MSNIRKIKILKKEYCIKRIEIPLNYKELFYQHKYVNYLNRNNINTPKIKFSFILSFFRIEVQEYVDVITNKINIDELVLFIAKYHVVSNKYKDKFYKKNFYVTDFKCNDVRLKKLLLGFDDKYFTGPMTNYNNQNQTFNRKKYDKIKDKYTQFYKLFKDKYYKEECIIHNDITSNNILFSNGIYIIDFDLSTFSTVYVDFVDSILKRSTSLDDIISFLEKPIEIKKLVDLYNSINNKLKFDGVIIMIALKICAYNFYVSLNDSMMNLFDENIKKIEKIMLIVERIINE